MTGQLWLAATLAVIMIGTSGYCLARLAVSWLRHRPTDRQVDGMHLLMGFAMAGMLVPRLRLLWTGGWEIIFAAGAAAFAWRIVRAARPGAPHRPSHDAQHLLSCGAMLYMLAFLAPLATRAASADSAEAVMSGSAHPGSSVPLVLAVALLGCVVWTADRMSSMAPVAALTAVIPAVAAGSPGAAGLPGATGSPGAAGSPLAAGPGAPAAPVPLSARLSACCEIAIGVTMGYMLIVMIR